MVVRHLKSSLSCVWDRVVLNLTVSILQFGKKESHLNHIKTDRDRVMDPQSKSSKNSDRHL